MSHAASTLRADKNRILPFSPSPEGAANPRSDAYLYYEAPQPESKLAFGWSDCAAFSAFASRFKDNTGWDTSTFAKATYSTSKHRVQTTSFAIKRTVMLIDTSAMESLRGHIPDSDPAKERLFDAKFISITGVALIIASAVLMYVHDRPTDEITTYATIDDAPKGSALQNVVSGYAINTALRTDYYYPEVTWTDVYGGAHRNYLWSVPSAQKPVIGSQLQVVYRASDPQESATFADAPGMKALTFHSQSAKRFAYILAGFGVLVVMFAIVRLYLP